MARSAAFFAGLAAVSCLTGLSGCTAGDESAPVAGPTESGSAAAPKPTDVAASEMVAAISGTSGDGDVSIRFDLPKRPVLNDTVDITVAVIPRTSIDRLQVVFQSFDGLRVVANSNLGPIEKPKIDAEIRHVVSVTPIKEGVFSLSAVALVESSATSVSRTYSIPLIVGGAEDASSTPAAGASADSPASSAPAAP
jgi:hypothetical protein